MLDQMTEEERAVWDAWLDARELTQLLHRHLDLMPGLEHPEPEVYEKMARTVMDCLSVLTECVPGLPERFTEDVKRRGEDSLRRLTEHREWHALTPEQRREKLESVG